MLDPEGPKDCESSEGRGVAEQEVKANPEEGEEEEDGDEWERRCYLRGQEHDSWAVREREAGEWPLGDEMDEDEDDVPPLTQFSDDL